jgi:polyhydroxyalkanoate synthesis regulator phasin
MLDTMQRLVDFGIGALNMTRERAEKLFDECVRRGQADRGHREQFVRDLMDAAEQTRQDLENLVSRQVERVLARLNIATREDLLRLEHKIDQLLTRTP